MTLGFSGGASYGCFISWSLEVKATIEASANSSRMLHCSLSVSWVIRESIFYQSTPIDFTTCWLLYKLFSLALSHDRQRAWINHKLMKKTVLDSILNRSRMLDPFYLFRQPVGSWGPLGMRHFGWQSFEHVHLAKLLLCVYNHLIRTCLRCSSLYISKCDHYFRC